MPLIKNDLLKKNLTEGLLNNSVSIQGNSHQKGFSLIEVLISMLLMSVGMLGLTSLQSRSVNYSTAAYTETQSTLYLQEIVELLRANKTAAIEGNYNTALSSFADLSGGSSMAEKDRYNWFNNLDNVLSGAKASINCGTNAQCVLELQYEFSGELQKRSIAVIL